MATPDAIPSKKHLPFGGARAINNHVIEEFINYVMSNDFMLQVRNPVMVHRFMARYRTWLASSEYNLLTGFDALPVTCYANGTTEIFDKWYIRHHNRRLRIFRGEYMYHYATHRNLGLRMQWLEDEPLDYNDHVIISMPFADSGDLHYETMAILDTATLMNVPVLIDATYLGLTNGIEFDFSHPAIDTVAVSLSKVFPVAHARIGMRMSRTDIDDGLDIYRKTEYENRWGAALGYSLIDNYGIDYNYQTYGHWQKYKCQELNIKASPTVLFGLGGEEWEAYNRGGLYNRLYLGGLYERQI